MNHRLEKLKREAPEWDGPWLNISSVSLATLPCLQRRWPPICLTITWRIISSMSLQMSQVLPLAEDKAANLELQLAFSGQNWQLYRKLERLEGECFTKVQGEVTSARSFCVEKWCVRVCAGLCVCAFMCVCVSLVYFTDWSCWWSPVLTN